MNYQKTYKKQLLPAIISICTLPLFAGGAIAQEESVGLEEIVVTARKRQESIQDVPVAVSAISPGQLERGSITSSLDLGKMVPNVELHETGIGSESLSASIRGMSYDDIEKSIEPTVGVAIDGVFLASNSGGVFDLFDVAAVEVLRGPQGTLFGRNTIGGVINVTRTEPTGDFGMKLEAIAGDENLADIKGIVNMPLSDKGGIKLSFKNTESDSHVYNTTIEGRRPFKDSETLGLAVKYNFTDNTSAVLSYDDYEHNTTAPDNVNPFGGMIESEADGWATSPQKDPLTAYLKGENTTLRVTHNADNYEIKYIMGIMDYSEVVREKSWGTSIDFFQVDRDQDFKQTSHELQYLSNLDGPMNFVAGLYMLKAESFITSGPGQNFNVTHDLDSKAIFGELNYQLNDLWSLTLGARYTEEEKDLNTRSYNGGADGNAARLADSYDAEILNFATPSFDDDNTSYRVVLQREIESGMMYASFSTGYRSGGFFNRGITPLENESFKSEEVESFELGMRSNPTANSQVNLTYFNADYTDKQTTVITSANDPMCDKQQNPIDEPQTITCSFVRNAGAVSMQGVEFEGMYMPSDNLTLRLSFGTFDGEYDEYDYNGVDISEKARLLYAPELTAYFGAEHTSEVAGGVLTLNGGLSFKDDVDTQADWATWSGGTEVVIESFESLDLSATFVKDMGTGTLKLRAYGTDVLEDGNRVSRRYDAGGGFSWAELAPRRQFGVSVGYEF